MDTLHTIIFWLTPLAITWLTLLSCVRLTSPKGYRVFPSRELLAVIALTCITFSLPLIDSTLSTKSSAFVKLGLSHIENAVDRIGPNFGPPRITGVHPVPGSPNMWQVTFSEPIMCMDRIALITRGRVQSSFTQDCTGEPRSALTFRFKEILEPGTEITKFAMLRSTRIVDRDGEALSTYYFAPVVVQER